MPRKYRHIKDYEKRIDRIYRARTYIARNREIFDFEYKEMRNSKQDTTKIKRNLRQE